MAKQTSEETKHQSAGEIKSDIILILDKMQNLLQAVSQLDAEGNCQTVPADSKRSNSFLKIDKFSSVVENFFSNFWSQVRDPARFGLFSMKKATLTPLKTDRR